MKRSLLALIPLLALSSIIGGCGDKKGSGPVTAKSYETYNDEILKFSVRHPAEWAKGVQPGVEAVFYSSTSVGDGFTRYEPKGQRGAKVDVGSMLGGQEAMNKSIEDLKAPFTDPNVVKAPEQTTLNGMPATKISYSFDVEDTKFTAERFYVMKDSVVSFIETAVIGNYNDYAGIFDTARASFKPGTVAARTAAAHDSTGARKDSDLVEPPSATMKAFGGSNFSIQYPSNFTPGTARAGGAIESKNFSGARNDSYFQIDVIAAKDMTLQEIVDQNKKSYGGRAASPASVGNLKGFVFNYNGGKDVSSRAYFAMSNGKLYRITMNWFRAQQESYLPAFEKALATFQAK
ncbi:MAG TPA: hypothetical protein VHI13_16220 [Candidatus Kapabacteria bacterium]|nr:hypothetical protein [Candidatus Kapabacteria bacterium]